MSPHRLAASYDKVARQYHDRVEPVYAAIADRILERINLTGAERVLEVGAGTGCLTRPISLLLARGHLTATDISIEMLKVCHAALDDLGRFNVTVLLDDMTAMDFMDGQFDLVISQLTPLLNGLAPLREAFRVLRSGGRIAAAAWDEDHEDDEDKILGRIHEQLGMSVTRPTAGRTRLMVRRLCRAGFVDARTEPFQLTVTHADYVGYRKSFPLYVSQRASVRRRYERLLLREVASRTGAGRQLELRLTLIFVTARKP